AAKASASATSSTEAAEKKSATKAAAPTAKAAPAAAKSSSHTLKPAAASKSTLKAATKTASRTSSKPASAKEVANVALEKAQGNLAEKVKVPHKVLISKVERNMPPKQQPKTAERKVATQAAEVKKAQKMHKSSFPLTKNIQTTKKPKIPEGICANNKPNGCIQYHKISTYN
ncbi:hypothetical protein WA026_017220, partial [Henosepilachna vigintioctopunctata]